MKQTLILVNGEEFWEAYFPDYEVQHIRLQTSRWLLHEEQLWVFDTTHKIKTRVDNILWRIQAVRPFPHYHAILELIRYAQVPCVNPVSVMLRSLDRLSMLNELREIGLPVVPFTGIAGAELM